MIHTITESGLDLQEKSSSILLLHGLGVYGESWWYQKQALHEAGYFPIAPDLPGFGSTPADEHSWSVAKAAESAVRVLDQAGIEQTVVCGLSMGGVVALELALSRPDRLSGLVLINTFAALRPANLGEVIYFVRRGARTYLRSPADQAEKVAQRVFPHPTQGEWRKRLVESIRSSDPVIYRKSMMALAKFNVSRKLDRITMPTLVITGTEDSTIPPQVQTRMARKIPGAVQYLIHGAGHGVIVDHYEEVNALLLDFLAQIYPS